MYIHIHTYICCGFISQLYGKHDFTFKNFIVSKLERYKILQPKLEMMPVKPIQFSFLALEFQTNSFFL